MENRENCTKHPCSGLELACVSFCPIFTGQNFEQGSSWIQGVSGNAPLPGQLVLSHPVHYGSGAHTAASFTWPAFSEHLAITRPDAECLGHTIGGDTALSSWELPSMFEGGAQRMFELGKGSKGQSKAQEQWVSGRSKSRVSLLGSKDEYMFLFL